MTPSSQYLYCVGTKPLGSHHRFTTQNCESMYMKFLVKFRMCLLEFFLKERERKNKHNFGGLHACKKFPTLLLLNVWAYPIWELGVVCTIIFLQLNNYCINLYIQEHCANFKERETEWGRQTQLLRSKQC